jgi:hypothetical protein
MNNPTSRLHHGRAAVALIVAMGIVQPSSEQDETSLLLQDFETKTWKTQ